MGPPAVRAVVLNCINIVALPIIRSLGRKDIDVTGIFSSGKRYHFYSGIIRNSKYMKRRICFDESAYESELINTLVEWGKKCGTQSTLFLASDQDMIAVSKHRDQLKEYFLFLLPPHETLIGLLNKHRFVRVAQNCGLPIPKSAVAFCGEDIEEATREFEFPFIIKPSWRDNDWLDRFGEQKVFQVNSRTDLKEMDTEFVVQEVIPGNERNIFCSFAVLDVDSNPIEMGHCRKIRQHPRHFGNTSLAETIQDDDLGFVSTGVFKKLGLKGYASIEYKRDPRDNQLKIIEVTAGRFNRQFAVTGLAGMNLPYTLYNYLVGADIKPAKAESGNARWASEVNELRSMKAYVSSKEYSLLSWVKELGNVKCYEIFDKKDLVPFVALFRQVALRKSEA